MAAWRGDFILADDNGTVVIPMQRIAEVVEFAKKVKATEDRVIAEIRAGADPVAAVVKLGESVRARGIRKPMLVTDAGLAAGAVMARVLEAIDEFQPVIFDGTPQNPDQQAVEAGVALYEARGCGGVIALGGGSPIAFPTITTT